ncbi:MAG: class I SAM-dependent methyltransferase, partial [Haloplanus sp.]
MPDPFARALRDHDRGERDAPLLVHGDDESRVHPVEEFYFAADGNALRWIERWLDGPLLDLGAGVGRDAWYFQMRFETVAVEVSAPLVETMRDRGVADARRGDMFALHASFPPDRFRSVLIRGTQLGLAGSLVTLRETLATLDAVTTAEATVVVDGYDP